MNSKSQKSNLKKHKHQLNSSEKHKTSKFRPNMPMMHPNINTLQSQVFYDGQDHKNSNYSQQNLNVDNSSQSLERIAQLIQNSEKIASKLSSIQNNMNVQNNDSIDSFNREPQRNQVNAYSYKAQGFNTTSNYQSSISNNNSKKRYTSNPRKMKTGHPKKTGEDQSLECNVSDPVINQRLASSQKKTAGGAQQNLMRSSAQFKKQTKPSLKGSLQQQHHLLSLQHLQLQSQIASQSQLFVKDGPGAIMPRHGQAPQFSGSLTTTNAAIRDSRSVGQAKQPQGARVAMPSSAMVSLQPEQLQHLNQLRQSSIQSNHSKDSLGQPPEQQFRRRQYGPNQNGQGQNSGRFSNKKARPEARNTEEASTSQGPYTSNQSDGVKVISKKLINFRPQSNANKRQMHEGQAEIFAQAEVKKAASQATAQDKSSFYVSPSNGVQIQQKLNPTNQLSPRKQGTETYGQGAVGGTPSQKATNSQKPINGKSLRGKPRLISGHPGRRIPQDQNSIQMAQDPSGQFTAQSTKNQQKQDGSLATQGLNWRRQPQQAQDHQPGAFAAFDSTQKVIAVGRNQNGAVKASLQSNRQSSKKSLKTLPMSTLDSQMMASANQTNNLQQNSVQVDFERPSAPQGKQMKTLGGTLGQNINSASSLHLETAKGQEKQSQVNVIFHPHPFNNNVNQGTIEGFELNALGSQRAPIGASGTEQGTLDSGRPASNRMQMNNRNSRKNLRPLGNSKKLQGQQQYGQTLNQQQRQFAPYQTAQIQGAGIGANLNRQVMQNEGSLTKDGARALQAAHANSGSSFQIGQQQMLAASENYQVQVKEANVTNKNALFKFKKESQTNRLGYQSQGLEQQSAKTTTRRPIMQPAPPMAAPGGSMTRQVMQQMQPGNQVQSKFVGNMPKQIKSNKMQTAQSSSQGKERNLFNIPGQTSRGEIGLLQGTLQPNGKTFKPSQTVAFSGSNSLQREEQYSLAGGQDTLNGQVNICKLPMTLTRQSESNERLPVSMQQPHTARIGQAGGDILNPKISEKAQNESLQATMLGSLTHNTIQKGGQYQTSVGELQKTSQVNLPGGPKLIKVNKSKKMLDTARRSRIQQLDNKNNTQGSSNGVNALTLVAMNSNAAPPIDSGISAAASKTEANTTKAAPGVQLMSNSGPQRNAAKNQSNGRNQKQKRFGALIQTQQLASNSLRQSVEKDNGKKQQTLMNINADPGNGPASIQEDLLMTPANGAIISEHPQSEQRDNEIQIISARVASSANKEGSSKLERASKIGDGTGGKPLRRGQIFKKQMKNGKTSSVEKIQAVASLESVQSNPSLEVIKTIIDTKTGQEEVILSKNELEQPANPAVKIENQLSLNLSGDLPTDGTPEEQLRDQVQFTDLQHNTQAMTPIRKDSQESKIETQKISILNEISEEGAHAEVNQQSDNYQTHQAQQNPVSKVLKIQHKLTDQRGTAADTNSNRKQTTDSMQRTHINNSTQNVPRGLINTAFSLSSVASKDEVPPLPTTPQNILRYYIHELTDYEKGEILDYDMIYFLGKDRAKKVDGKNSGEKKESNQEAEREKGSTSSSQQKEGKEKKEEFNHNHGYDDDKGDYKIVTGDHIGYRYEIKEFLGKGSFGTALRCYDHKDKRELAVKIVKNKKKYYYQASVELKILQYLRQHDTEDIMNVIHIEDYVVFRKHLCMAFELLSMNLFEFLKINDFNGFDHNLIRRFAIQLLYALKYLKQLEIIHCDLKPENILLKEENKSGIKIIDFGSSTFIDEKVYTYIQSRFYRAPEIMLGIPYSPAIDMWSLGCIMAELYIGYPLFPGESENDQMSRVMEMRDIPPGDVLQISERKMKFFTVHKETRVLEPIMLKNSRGKLRKPNGKPLDYVIGDEDPDFNDFVAKCLDWNPETRLTPDQALKHVWVLKGLPPQVLIHHQKMHNIGTPELPASVKAARDEFLQEQEREQGLIQQQAQRRSKERQRMPGQKSTEGGREVSLNPNAGRPQIQLKTPRAVGQANGNTINPQLQKNLTTDSTEGKGASLDKAQANNASFAKISAYPGTTKNQQQSGINQPKIAFAQTTKINSKADGTPQQPQGNTRRKFVIKKINKTDQQ